MVLTAATLLLLQPQAPIAELDFELVNGHIYVPATVNGNKSVAVIDSGAGMSVMDFGLAQHWKLPISGNLQANGIGNQSVSGGFLKNTTITFGGLSLPMTIAIPLGDLTKAEGRALENVVGYEFFRKYIVEIDYAARKLRAYPNAEDRPTKGSVLPIRLIGNHPHIKTQMKVGEKVYDLETMIDTGASGGGLTSKFLKANPLSAPTTPKSVIGGGVGGFVQGRFFRPDWIKVDTHTAARPVMTLSDEDGGASGAKSSYDLLLGADVLKRFKVTFDYSRKKMVFEPNQDLGKRFEFDKVGMRLYAEGPDLRSYKVVSVMAGSGAELAGIKADDVVETIDGKPVSGFALHQLREQFRSADTKGWEFGIRRGGQLLQVKVTAKEII